MKAFRYYAIDDKGNLLPPVPNLSPNKVGKYGNIPLVNMATSELYVNNAPHKGTSIIIPGSSKFSIYDAKSLINTAFSAYIRNRKDIFDYYNKLSGNFLDKAGYSWDELGDLLKSYWYNEKTHGDKIPAALNDTVDEYLNGVVGSVKSKDSSENYKPEYDKGTHSSLGNRLGIVHTEDTGLKDYNNLFTAVSSMYDVFKRHPSTKNKDIGLYQVEFDDDDLFSGKDYLENKETAQVDFPQEGKVKVNKVYPTLRLDISKVNKAIEDSRKLVNGNNMFVRNDYLKTQLEPVLGVSDEEVPSDERLKVIKHHNNWLGTQHIVPIVQRGML